MNRIPGSLAILDTQRRIVFMNRAMEALTGFGLTEAKGVACKHILRSNLCGTRCPLRRLNPDSEPFCTEGDILSRYREKIPVRITFSPLVNMRGELSGWMEFVEDLRALHSMDQSRPEAFSFGPLLGQSEPMERVFRMVPGIAQTDSSVLVTGETGTGKDILAEVIHQHSTRAKGPFVKVNCGALPETLLESELFGHRKGAFTGATENKPGRFKLAHNGTLFLTEIGDLPLPLQVKLLSFLDDQVVYPLGSTKGVQLDVRIIGATHQNLQKMVQEGRFREDLMYRLNVVRIHLPPLRERQGDVSLLMDHFLQLYVGKFGKSIRGFSKETRRFLQSYSYPGNVRELKNIVEFAVNVCSESEIQMEHIPGYLLEEQNDEPGPSPMPAGPEEAVDKQEPRESASSWPELEKKMILDALYRAKGKRSKAAEILGWGRSTLWRKMKQYEIDA
jgi:transcriptional regulator with PAS, ATPase and Fis domain